MKKVLIVVALVIVMGAIATDLLYNKKPKAHTTNVQQSAVSGDIVPKTGIHWHPVLSIYIKGKKQVIPTDIGIGNQYSNSKWYDSMMDMTDVHTHDDSGTLHWEVMDGPVTKDHVRLSVFFEIWGKHFNKNCIFDSCNGSDGTVKMTVNGQPNTEFQNYQVHDNDKIEVRYE